MEIAPKLARAN